MKKCSTILLFAFLPVLAEAALLPEALGRFNRESVEQVKPDNEALFDEFGFDQAERAIFRTREGDEAVIVAERYYDDTGAYSSYLWQRPADGEYAEFGKRAWRSREGILIQFGNYVVRMTGAAPIDDDVELMLAYLPRVRVTVDPPVLSYVPDELVVPGTRRHILGPEALDLLAPEVSPSAAGFHFGTEVQFARYRVGDREERMLLFAYPTPQIARAQIEKFYELEGVVAKRSGPIIAAVVAPASEDGAQRLLAKVRYEAEVTMDYKPPSRHDNLGTLLMDVILLCIVLAALCIVGGLLVAGVRLLAGRYAPSSIIAAPEGDGMVHLELDQPEKR